VGGAHGRGGPQPRPMYPAGFIGWLPVMVLLGGLFVSLVCSALSYSEARARDLAERQRPPRKASPAWAWCFASGLDTRASSSGWSRRASSHPGGGGRLLRETGSAAALHGGAGGRPREYAAELTSVAVTPLLERLFQGERVPRGGLRTNPLLGGEWLSSGGGVWPIISCLGVPVRSAAGDHGRAAVRPLQAQALPAEHVQLVEGLAAQASVALDNARLYREHRTPSGARGVHVHRLARAEVAPHRPRVALQTLESLARSGLPPSVCSPPSRAGARGCSGFPG